MYVVTKLGYRENPEHDTPSYVGTGVQMCGQAAAIEVPTVKAIEWANKYKNAKTDEEKAEVRKAIEASGEDKWRDQWEERDTLIPRIGWPVFFRSCRMDAGTLRTSDIFSYYIHGEESSDHPDKLLLPREILNEIEHIEFPTLSKGDVILCTATSIYLCEISENYNKRMKPIWEEQRRQREKERKNNKLKGHFGITLSKDDFDF
jgi:hypothetical protein